MRLPALAHVLLVPGAAVFSLRAALEAAGVEPAAVPGLDAATGIGGPLSLLGLVLALAAGGTMAVGGALLVLVGHFLVSPHVHDLGAGFVYLGTGLLVVRWTPRAAAPAAVAMAGALLRGGSVGGHVLVAVGAGWLAVWLASGTRTYMHGQG